MNEPIAYFAGAIALAATARIYRMQGMPVWSVVCAVMAIAWVAFGVLATFNRMGGTP